MDVTYFPYNNNNNCYVLIPAYNPDENLIKLIRDLNQQEIEHILIVNDGSNQESLFVFKSLKELKCEVIEHEENQGKGAALKTGIKHIMEHYPQMQGIVTADADGQHLPKDIVKLMDHANNHPECMILGSRDFSDNDIPFRSRFGNIVTRYVIRFETNFKLKDTQTGLRYIPHHYAKKILAFPGKRYEFEMNMIINAQKHDIGIEEVPIETVYLNDNKSSHFNPIIDSIRIYFVFFKFILSSVSSFLLDLLLYSIFIWVFDPFFETKHVIVATVLARILSALFNYTVNKQIVFQSDTHKSLFKYAWLSIAVLAASASSVYLIYSLIGHGEIIIKIIVDTILFLISYFVQKIFIFKRKISTSI